MNGEQSSPDPPVPVLQGSKLQLPPSCDPPSLSNPPEPSVWVVFGATGHIGRSLVKAALSHNDLVAAVGQSYEDTISSVFPPSPPLSLSFQPFKPQQPQNPLPLLCDVRIRETVDATIQRSISHFGRIDVIVNCSGYGIIGAAEDQDEYDIRNQFEVNYWGTLNIIQLSLPYLRERYEKGGSNVGGRYCIFSSTSGSLGVPGLGPFCGAKYAVEGLVESLMYEVARFNIKCTLVELGYARRDDLPITNSKIVRNSAEQSGTSLNPLPLFGHFSIKPVSAPYASPDAPAGHAKRMLQFLAGDKQPTSVVRIAEVIWQLAHCGCPPLRLSLGGMAVESARDRLRWTVEEVEEWKWLGFSQDENIVREDETMDFDYDNHLDKHDGPVG